MGLGHGNSLSWWNLTGGTDSLRTYIATNKVVQSGLVLNLDSGASTSYPGSGTTWTDLSDKISTATGALPIYNTTDTIGAVKGSGTRTDAFASSLVLAIPMDGANNGTTFTDESANIKGSGSAKTITRNGNAKTVTALSKFYGSSGFFDGSGVGYLVSNGGGDLGSGDFTIELWTYLISRNSTYPCLFGNYDSFGSGAFGFFAGHNNVSTKYTIYANGSGTPITSSSDVIYNSWTHLAVVRSGSTVTIYINGVADSSGTISATLDRGGGTAYIGSIGDALSISFLNGYLQDLRVYKGLAKYTANFTPPGSPNNATLTNGPTYSTANGGSIVFDGTNDYVYTTTQFTNPQTFSIGAWFKTSTASGKKIIGFESNQTGTGSISYDRMIWIGTNGKLYFGIYDNAFVTATSPLSYNDNNWHYVIATYGGEGTTMRLYVDGVSVATASANAPAYNGWWRIAGYGLDGNVWSNSIVGYFPGSISNVVVYNKGLTAAEVTQNFNAFRGRYGI